MKKKIIIIISSLLFLFLVAGIVFVKVGTSPVDKKDNKEVIFKVSSGESRYNIVANLKKAGLIKNKLSGYIFVTLHHNLKPQAADYSLKRSMSLKEMFVKFDKGEKYVMENFQWTPEMEKVAEKIKKVSKTLNGKVESPLADKLVAEK